MGGIMAMIMGAVMPGSVTGALINDVEPDIDDEGLDDIIDYVHPVDKIFADWQAAAGFLKSCFSCAIISLARSDLLALILCQEDPPVHGMEAQRRLERALAQACTALRRPGRYRTSSSAVIHVT